MEENILKLFCYAKKLKFSEIEGQLEVRSNKLAYYLKQLVGKGVLVQSEEGYSLSEESERSIPYLSRDRAVLPVVLVHIGDGRRAFLAVRDKRPYFGLYGLPGGRLLVGESVEDGAVRIMKDKFGIGIVPEGISSMSLEHVSKDGHVLHSFLLILIKASCENTLEMVDVVRNRKKIISSDYSLITSGRNFEVQLDTINSQLVS